MKTDISPSLSDDKLNWYHGRNPSNWYVPSRRGRNYEVTVKEETCQMAGFLKTTTNNRLPLNGQQVSSPWFRAQYNN